MRRAWLAVWDMHAESGLTVVELTLIDVDRIGMLTVLYQRRASRVQPLDKDNPPTGPVLSRLTLKCLREWAFSDASRISL